MKPTAHNPSAYYPAGLTGPTGPVSKNFRSIDLDVWARQFLATVDLVLSAPYATPLFQLGGPTGITGPTGPAPFAAGATGFTAGGPGRAAFDALVSAKERLAERIAQGLDYILEGPTGPTAGVLRHDAREVLRQNLLINLSNAYATAAILQPRFLIPSGGTGATGAPRLSGKPVEPPPPTEGPVGFEDAYSISTGKLPMVEGESNAAFLFNLSSEDQHKNVTLDLNYVVNEMEYDIQPADKIEQYEPSSWLSFIVPIGSSATQPEVKVDTRLGELEIPVPLRAYPVLPSLIAQAATASVPDSNTLAEAKLWDYSCTFEYQPAAQDTVFLLVSFNLFDEHQALAMARQPDLFDWLAQFASIYPELKNGLALLPAWKPGQAYDAPLLAASTLADLAQKIANVWRVYPPAPVRPDDIKVKGQKFLYQLDVTRTGDNQFLDTLRLTLLERPVGSTLAWPSVYVGDQKLTVTGPPPPPDQILYKYPPDIPAAGPLTQRFVFTRNDIIQIFNAWTAVSIARNLLLVDAGPEGAAAPFTNAGFVYTTPLVGFTNKLTPLLTHNRPIDIAGITGPPAGKTLAQYLSILFQQLLEIGTGPSGPRPNVIKVASNYGYSLASTGPTGAGAALMAYLPILMQPKFNFHSSDLGVTGPTAFVSRLASQIETWQGENRPSRNRGVYSFDVSVFSPEEITGITGPTGPAAPQPPIFEVPNFQLQLSDIQGPTGINAHPSETDGGTTRG